MNNSMNPKKAGNKQELFKLLVFVAIIILTVFVDLFSKALVKNSALLTRGGTIELIPGVFRLRYVENQGAAFGSLSNSRWLFMAFSSVAIVVLLYLLIRKRRTLSYWAGVAISLIIGGGIGNMYERLFNVNAQGVCVVTDFFDFYPFSFWKWIFNVADVAVCVGAAILVLYYFVDTVKTYRQEKKQKAVGDGVSLNPYTLLYEDLCTDSTEDSGAIGEKENLPATDASEDNSDNRPSSSDADCDVRQDSLPDAPENREADGTDGEKDG